MDEGRHGAGGTLELVEAELASVFPGAVVLDRELSLGTGRGAIELVAVDGEGRLLLVLGVDAGEAAAVVTALDALAFARENLPLLAQHYPDGGLDPAVAPLVVLAAERFEPALLARLGGLDPTLLLCLEIRRLASRERQRAYLVPVAAPTAPGRGGPAGARPHDFLQHLGADVRGVGERLLERLQRIDEDLTASGSGRQLRFALDGEPICVVSAHPEALEARVLPAGGSFRISTFSDVDAFLEEVLQRALELFEPGGSGSLLVPGPELPEVPELDPESMREAALDPLMPSGAILTAEEIEAFRAMR